MESKYQVCFTPEASDQLVELYQYISEHGSPVTAETYTSAIVTYCEDLHTFPHRGTKRNDVLPGLRITNYRKTAVIAFSVSEEQKLVTILGVFYGGQNYEELLSNDN